jgi:NAD-dependent SIR2 family protein deacetylase
MAHNNRDFVTNLGTKLATRSRHVCVFLGAGAAKACGLPDVGALQKGVLANLEASHRALLAKQLNRRNLEQALSRIRIRTSRLY